MLVWIFYCTLIHIDPLFGYDIHVNMLCKQGGEQND
jgi:hypothetical protein